MRRLKFYIVLADPNGFFLMLFFYIFFIILPPSCVQYSQASAHGKNKKNFELLPEAGGDEGHQIKKILDLQLLILL